MRRKACGTTVAPLHVGGGTMRIVTIPAAAMLVVGLTFAPAFAGQHGQPTTPHGGGPKASPHNQPTTQGQAHATPTTTTARAHGNPHTTSTSTTPTTTREHGNRHTTSTTTPTTTATNPIATKISSHPQQAARIERMLPQGM